MQLALLMYCLCMQNLLECGQKGETENAQEQEDVSLMQTSMVLAKFTVVHLYKSLFESPAELELYV